VAPADFEIEITQQGWLDPELHDDPYDLCSHGDIRLTVGGQIISPGDGEGDYTVSTSALALLRTLESDHSPERPVAVHLVLCCGMLTMESCPIGIDWSVTHLGERVRLHDVVRYDSVDTAAAVRFPGLNVDLAAADYRRRVVALAEKAKEPFAGSEKALDDKYQRTLYEEFWREYDQRLRRAST